MPGSMRSSGPTAAAANLLKNPVARMCKRLLYLAQRASTETLYKALVFHSNEFGQMTSLF
jgi:hypothetical protein